jgi:hypothetical protein
MNTPIAAIFAVSATIAMWGCGDDGSPAGTEDSTSAQPSTGLLTDATTGVPQPLCMPGEIRCQSVEALERCAPTGKSWVTEPCPSQTTCTPCDSDSCTEDQCLGPCDSIDDLPSSAGCSFIANRQLHAVQAFEDGLVVANPNSTVDAHVTLYQTPEGTNQEEMLEEAVLAPLESTMFLLSQNFVQGDTSMFRTGGTYRVQSDVPVVAYHHAPYALSHGNDSSLLLPESALRREYVVMSYGPNVDIRQGEPSYFEVVALENYTTLEWYPPVATAGNGLPIPAVPGGGKGTLKLNRFDTVRIAASGIATDIIPERDVSGTVVVADKPIWVTSGVACGRVPTRDLDVYPVGFCDPLQEMPIPLEYWGNTYVGVHSPVRTNERHWWRIYAGTDGVEVTTDPPQGEGTFTFEKRGDFVDLAVPSGTHVVFRGDNGVFMPVQYLESRHYGSDPAGEGLPEPEEDGFAAFGDPAMYQMVPVEQFLERYVFATALNFAYNYVQVIRPAGGVAIDLDGEPVDEALFEVVAEFEVATVPIEEGSHLIESVEAFGIIQVGYSLETYDERCLQDPPSMNSCPSSYAYPGGMKSDPIYIP